MTGAAAEKEAVPPSALRRFLGLPPKKRLLKVVFGVASLGAAYHLALPYLLPVRPLTGGEEAMLHDVFKDAIDYKKTGIHHSRVMDVRQKFYDMAAEAAGSKVIYSSEYYRPDFSKTGEIDRSTFMHEHVHVWQFQNCRSGMLADVFTNAGKRTVASARDWLGISGNKERDKVIDEIYLYDLSKGNDLLDFNIEQQGNIIGDYLQVKNGDIAFSSIPKNPAREDYERVLAKFLADPSYPKKTCLF